MTFMIQLVLKRDHLNGTLNKRLLKAKKALLDKDHRFMEKII